MTGLKNYVDMRPTDAVVMCARALEHVDTVVLPEEIRPAVRVLLREAIETCQRYPNLWGLEINHKLALAEGILAAAERGADAGR